MSIVAQAKSEMKRAGFPDSEIAVMGEILDKFFDTWDSGGAVWAMAPVLQRLIAGQPLTPLTGDDDEWMEVGEGVFQNVRDSSVFKDPRFHDGKLAYDIDAPDPRAAITFPYEPPHSRVSSPVIEISTEGTAQ
jgi:hypothetical protein